MRSTGDAATFATALADGGRVHLLITDPPWLMYSSGLFKAAAPYALLHETTITNHLRLVRHAMVPGGHAYVFLPSGAPFEPALRNLIDDGWTFNRLLAWDKAPHGGGGIGSTWSGAFEPIALLSNGKPRPFPAQRRMYPTLLRQRPTKTRTAKPIQLYRVFLEASTHPGDLAIDPYCGTDPLQAAATQEPSRRWRTNDILTPAAVRAQTKPR